MPPVIRRCPGRHGQPRSLRHLPFQVGRYSYMDDAHRLDRIRRAIATSGQADPATYPHRVCSASVGLLGVSGVGLTLMTNSEQGGLWASNEVVRWLEDAQLGLGEGPGLEAFEQGVPVLEPNLGDVSARWPLFRSAALDLGVAAVFAFPLQVGVIRLGALNLYRDRPGLPTNEELSDTLVLTDVATQGILDLQAQGSIYWRLFDPNGERARVHRATGIIAAQINSDMATALACMRSYAFGSGCSIYEVADDVIAHRLRLKRHASK